MRLEELSGKTSWGILLRVKIAAGKLLPGVGRRRCHCGEDVVEVSVSRMDIVM
jgi:hypothetical protein